MAGKKVQSDEWVTIALTCKEMGWSFEEYQSAPLPFLQTIHIFRHCEAEEARLREKFKQ